ncbi:hypothetical protein GCM10011591_04960 [Nocardia camponoti]|uniref:Uncharacterized protein n=1 Tax=Nocardia camponoti TaxID=1616106 RepID=A0A917Q9I7_9NOCA|nr:hypothetical protein GCM10011591_04960 [Nocardia camponoti]
MERRVRKANARPSSVVPKPCAKGPTVTSSMPNRLGVASVIGVLLVEFVDISCCHVNSNPRHYLANLGRPGRSYWWVSMVRWWKWCRLEDKESGTCALAA